MSHPHRVELGWSNPPGSYTEELVDGVHAVRMGPVTPEYVQRLASEIEREPGNTEIRRRYAEILGGLGRAADALAQWREILRVEPNSRYAHSMAAGLLRESGETSAAIDHYRRALELASDNPSEQAITRWGLAEALRQGGAHGEALAELERAVDLLEEGVRREAASPHLLRQLRMLRLTWRKEQP